MQATQLLSSGAGGQAIPPVVGSPPVLEPLDVVPGFVVEEEDDEVDGSIPVVASVVVPAVESSIVVGDEVASVVAWLVELELLASDVLPEPIPVAPVVAAPLVVVWVELVALVVPALPASEVLSVSSAAEVPDPSTGSPHAVAVRHTNAATDAAAMKSR